MEPLTLLLLAFSLLTWVLVLRRRSRVWTKQLAFHKTFARDRNEIIDSLGRDESLEAILNRLCSLVDLYLPGSNCRIDLIREGGVARDTSPGGIPITSVGGKTVAVMRLAEQPKDIQSVAALDEMKHLTGQAIEQRRLYDRLLRQSPQSMLEGIADRVLLDQRLEAALTRARACGHGVALIHVGLESFEDINEALGTGAAEVVLHCAAFRLLACTRPSDHVARIGRDEFSVILTELGGRADAKEVARRIVSSLDAPIGVQHANIQVGAAVGICVFPDQAADASEMQRRAHLAMYSAKSGAKSQFSFYEEEAADDFQSDPEEPSHGQQATRDLIVMSSACTRTDNTLGTEMTDHPLNSM
jgi:diguanylate cyclase (GGDEF)-like protein